jgi:NTE family protein
MPAPRSSLFEGLSEVDVDQIYAETRPRRFEAGEVICREGHAGTSLFIIQAGLAKVIIGSAPDSKTSGPDPPLARLRPGDVIGEIALLTGAPHSATVVAIVPTEVLELGPEVFTTVLARYAVVRDNLIGILGQRLVRTSAQLAGRRQRGEVVGLLVGAAGAGVVDEVIGATRSASPRSVAAISLSAGRSPSGGPDRDGELNGRPADGVLAAIDDHVAAHTMVLVAFDMDQAGDLQLVVEHMDRVVALLAPEEVAGLGARLGPAGDRLEVALVHTGPSARASQSSHGPRVIRSIDLDQPRLDLAWLGRHVARTKLGLALGAGGAKGFAHVAALHVLEEAGYSVDYVTGSSVGAMVGCWLALGMDAAEVEATMRLEHRPEAVAAMFKLSFSGLSSGLDVMVEMLRRTTGDRTFADLQIPLGIMTVDLDTRQPALLTEGPLWRALLAATALPGMFPPYDYDGRRLVDGLALVPVPSDAVRQLGADVVISVNLSNRETLPAWPGVVPPEPAVARSGARLLDSLLEVIELAQLESSMRHAARADVVLTPHFGPGTWREFHLADLFLAAGREVARAQIVHGPLRELARPQGIMQRHRRRST